MSKSVAIIKKLTINFAGLVTSGLGPDATRGPPVSPRCITPVFRGTLPTVRGVTVYTHTLTNELCRGSAKTRHHTTKWKPTNFISWSSAKCGLNRLLSKRPRFHPLAADGLAIGAHALTRFSSWRHAIYSGSSPIPLMQFGGNHWHSFVVVGTRSVDIPQFYN
jgi:hypothetical protein